MKQKLFVLIVTLAVVPAVFAFSVAAWLNSQATMGPGLVEQFAIKNVEFNSNNSATVTVENTGGNSELYTVVFVSANVDGKNATLLPSGPPGGTLKSGVTANFTVTLQGKSHFTPNNIYEFTIISTKETRADFMATYNQTK
jgi:hypothetical protein